MDARMARAPDAAADQAERQGWYLVFTLLIFYIFSFIDRQIISLLVEPIKRDLQVTDTQIGLLQGLAFAIFYTLFGIPIGSGTAILVGGLVVAAVSGEGRTFTLPLLGEVRAWQFVFIVTGAPGLLLPLLLLSVREPTRRGLLKTAGNEAPTKLPLREVIAFMAKNGHFYSLHFIAMAMMAMLGYAVGAWLPTVMVRTYGLNVGTVGQVLGMSTITINTIGIFIAGRICDRLTKLGKTDAPIRVCFGVAIAVVATSALPAFMPTATLGLVLVPMISDYVLQDPMQIRWGLLIVVVTAGTIAAILLWFVRPVYRRQVA